MSGPPWRRCSACSGPVARLHVLEHGLAPDSRVVAWQHRLEPLQKKVAGGCHLTRDVVGLLTETGLRPERVEQAYLPGPAISRPWEVLLARDGEQGVSDDDSDRAVAAAGQLGLAVDVTRHGPARSLEEAAAARGVAPHQLVKTMVVRVSEGEHVFVLVPGDREIAGPSSARCWASTVSPWPRRTRRTT